MTLNSLVNQGNTASGQPVTKSSGLKCNWKQPELISLSFAHSAWIGANICVFCPLISNSKVLFFLVRLNLWLIPWSSYFKLWPIDIAKIRGCFSFFFLHWAHEGRCLMPFFLFNQKWCSEKARVGVIIKEVKDPRSVCKEWKYWHCKCTLEGKSSCFTGWIGYILFTGPVMDVCCQVKGFSGLCWYFILVLSSQCQVC